MNVWDRAGMAVRSAQAAIEAAPQELGVLAPAGASAVRFISGSPTKENVEGAAYLMGEVVDFVKAWRPDPVPTRGVLYIQPTWAANADRFASQALELLKQVDIQSTDAPIGVVEGQRMKIFISHCSADTIAATALVALIRGALNVSSRDIRCTSVEGYTLEADVDFIEQLRAEVFGSEILIALLSKDSLKSMFVLFELGARWGSNRYMIPLRIMGVKPGEIQAPLSALHSISSSSETDLHGLVETLGKKLGLATERPQVYLRELKTFLELGHPAAVSPGVGVPSMVALPPNPVPVLLLALSAEAKTILIEAATGKGNSIIRSVSRGGLSIQINGKEIPIQDDERTRANWDDALQVLVARGFIKGGQGATRVYSLTATGFQAADQLTK